MQTWSLNIIEFKIRNLTLGDLRQRLSLYVLKFTHILWHKQDLPPD